MGRFGASINRKEDADLLTGRGRPVNVGNADGRHRDLEKT
jgi:hypothetical protein